MGECTPVARTSVRIFRTGPQFCAHSRARYRRGTRVRKTNYITKLGRISGCRVQSLAGVPTMSPWQVDEQDGSIRARSASLCFRVSAECGGTIEEPDWPERPTLWTPKRLWTRPFTGPHYERYALNTFGASLSVGDHEPLSFSIEDEWLVVEGAFLSNDVVQRHVVRANAETGEIEIEDRVEKTGPGETKLQMVHEYHYFLNENLASPQAAISLPVGGEVQTLWTFEPSGSEIFDQDGHSVRRGRMLSEPWITVGQAGTQQVLRYGESEQMVCFMLHSTKKRGSVLLNTYGPDFVLTRDEAVVKQLKVTPEALPEDKTIVPPPVREPDRRARLETQAKALRDRLADVDAASGDVTAIRCNLAKWKLDECDAYLLDSEYGQTEGLLADAERALRAIDDNEPALLPEPGELLYENDFRRFPLDWMMFGFCQTENDDEKGFHLQPSVTTDMWTREEFEGSYVVEFEFCPTSDHFKGGTFLQLCGQCINPRDEFDFMASAMGSMPYYNFGIRCYHFSFNRGDLSVCNFRKTGKAFYILSQIAEPVRERGRWHKLHFVRNGAQFLFFVDGRLVQEYFDEGHQGEAYQTGHIGLRNWGRQSSWFRDFRIYRGDRR